MAQTTPAGKPGANKTAVSRALAAASSPDDGIAPEGRTIAGSFTSSVAALQVGQCAMRGHQIDPGLTMGEVSLGMTTWREALRDSVGASVREARKRTGGTYKVTVTVPVAADNHLYMIAIVTRTE